MCFTNSKIGDCNRNTKQFMEKKTLWIYVNEWITDILSRYKPFWTRCQVCRSGLRGVLKRSLSKQCCSADRCNQGFPGSLSTQITNSTTAKTTTTTDKPLTTSATTKMPTTTTNVKTTTSLPTTHAPSHAAPLDNTTHHHHHHHHNGRSNHRIIYQSQSNHPIK